ncbi:MAG: hypothetical protein JXR31_02925 [Prolixibacteraceae bacterium]|nr:hypothetical protein [Prolixibacteraceae bacterium]
MKKQCIGKSFEERIGIIPYLDEYTWNNNRVNSKFRGYMYGKRQATAEPVWGTLIQFMGLRKSIPSG